MWVGTILSNSPSPAAAQRCLEIEITERLPGVVAHDKAGGVRLLDRPRGREAACGRHGAMIARRRHLGGRPAMNAPAASIVPSDAESVPLGGEDVLWCRAFHPNAASNV